MTTGLKDREMDRRKAKLRTRLNKLENRYNEMVKEDGQRI